MTKIQIIVGTTRPGRVSEQIAKWALEQAQKRSDAEFEIVEVTDYGLPLYDEPTPPKMHNYTNQHTLNWAKKVNEADGYIFITAEYNHGIPASLKNALDFIYEEWTNKAAGIISYGSVGGVRAAEQLRLVLGELQIADVQLNTAINMNTDFENWSVFKPSEGLNEAVANLYNQTVAWTKALEPLRAA